MLLTIKQLLALDRRVRRLEKLMSDQTITTQSILDDITAIKSDFDSKTAAWSAQVQTLIDQLAAGAIDGTQVIAGLSGLKADIDAAALPTTPSNTGETTSGGTTGGTTPTP